MAKCSKCKKSANKNRPLTDGVCSECVAKKASKDKTTSTSTMNTPPSQSITPTTPAAPQKVTLASSANPPSPVTEATTHVETSALTVPEVTPALPKTPAPAEIPASTEDPATETAESTEASSSSGNQESSDPATPSENTKLFLLKFSLVAKPYRLPTITEVALAGQLHFQQEGMKCIPIRTRGETCYKFELREEVPSQGHVLQFDGLQVELLPWVKKQSMPRKEGTLITFQNAGTGALESIPGEVFDTLMENLKLVIIIPTRMQFYKQTRVLNGNRFCLVDTPANLKIIPESVPVVDPKTKRKYQVSITFRGQERYCSQCNEMHVGGCPKREERRKKALQREEMQNERMFNTKLYSDSTLRSVDVLGLKAEVACMSGGGLGQIIQAVMDDPEEEQFDKIIILGGTNDAKPENFPAPENFAYNIDMACAKLVTYAKKKPNKTFFLVQQNPIRDESQRHPEAITRDLYLNRRMKQLEENVSNIETFQVTYQVDQTGHPDEVGTRQILDVFDSFEISGAEIIWSEDNIVSDKIYSNVQSLFRYGCNGCDKYGNGLINHVHNNPLLCDECHERIPEQENEILTECTNRVQMWANAAVEARDNDYPIPEPKRLREENTDKDNDEDNDEDNDDNNDGDNDKNDEQKMEM